MVSERGLRAPPKGMGPDRDDGDVLFVERRGPTRTFLVIGCLCVIVVLGITFRDIVQDGEVIPSVIRALGALGVVMFGYALLAWAPGSTECKSIRVDRSGLRVGRQRLPASEVGSATVVSADEASSTALSGRYGDVRIGPRNGSHGFFANSGPAVFVKQERAGLDRPGWLIATNDPQGLLAALGELRRPSRKPAT